jgi:hypothetical protein
MFDFLFKKRISNAWNSESIEIFFVNWKAAEIRQKFNKHGFGFRINKSFMLILNRQRTRNYLFKAFS